MKRTRTPDRDYYGPYGWMTPAEAAKEFSKDLKPFMEKTKLAIAASEAFEYEKNRFKLKAIRAKASKNRLVTQGENFGFSLFLYPDLGASV